MCKQKGLDRTKKDSDGQERTGHVKRDEWSGKGKNWQKRGEKSSKRCKSTENYWNERKNLENAGFKPERRGYGGKG